MSDSTAVIVFLVIVLVVVAAVVAYQVLKGTGTLKRLGGGRGCIHCIDGFKVYADRVETPNGVAYFRDGPVTATVDTAGNLAIGRRATLTRMAAGGLLTGSPIGALIAGAGFKKDREHDARELYLLVEGPTLYSIGQFNPDTGAQVREFASDVNNASRVAQPSILGRGALAKPFHEAEPPKLYQHQGVQLEQPRPALPSVADELTKLAALKEKGVLTEEEFNSQKAKLLR